MRSGGWRRARAGSYRIFKRPLQLALKYRVSAVLLGKELPNALADQWYRCALRAEEMTRRTALFTDQSKQEVLSSDVAMPH